MISLGDRIKRYENVFDFYAVRRIPLMIRVDGKAFHTFTRGFDKPFDKDLMDAMVTTAIQVAGEMQGFKVAYIQSDEVTFCLTDYDKLETEGWFNYRLSKINSITASMMTAFFNQNLKAEKLGDKIAFFDSRTFNIPKNEVVNAFLWRAKDWERNSLQMYARSFFSHKQMHQKGKSDIHEMLHNIDKNWAADLSDIERNGTFLIKNEESEKSKIIIRTDILPNFQSIDSAIGRFFE